MEFKVVKEFGCAKKGDVFKLATGYEYGDTYVLDVNEKNSSRMMVLSEDLVNSLVKDGYLLASKKTETNIDKLNQFIDTKLKEYEETYKKIEEAYNEQECPACLKVEAETVYTNMSKLLNEIKRIINE